MDDLLAFAFCRPAVGGQAPPEAVTRRVRRHRRRLGRGDDPDASVEEHPIVAIRQINEALLGLIERSQTFQQ